MADLRVGMNQARADLSKRVDSESDRAIAGTSLDENVQKNTVPQSSGILSLLGFLFYCIIACNALHLCC